MKRNEFGGKVTVKDLISDAQQSGRVTNEFRCETAREPDLPSATVSPG